MSNVKFLLMENWVLVNFLFASLFHLQLIFVNLERAQASDKKWSGFIFHPLSYIIQLLDKANAPFWNFEIFFSRKVLNIKHFLVLNMGRSFSLVCSLHCHTVSVANDKNCHKTVSLGRDCEEALGKSSLILNLPHKLIFVRKKSIFFFINFLFWPTKCLKPHPFP